MIFETIPVGALQVNCYVLGCEQSRQAIVVDPGDNSPRIRRALERHGLQLAKIVVTHAHFDHLMAARSLQDLSGAPFYVHPADRPLVAVLRKTAQAWLNMDPGEPPAIDGDLLPGIPVTFGTETLEVRSTPGHSAGGVSLVHHASRRVLTGDALFAGSIGRTDLPGGDLAQLLDAIRTQLMGLPEDYAVLPGHGPASTIGRERMQNPFLTDNEPGSHV